MVLRRLLQVFGQLGNALSENRDLDVCRAGIFLMLLKFFGDLFLGTFIERHGATFSDSNLFRRFKLTPLYRILHNRATPSIFLH